MNSDVKILVFIMGFCYRNGGFCLLNQKGCPKLEIQAHKVDPRRLRLDFPVSGEL